MNPFPVSSSILSAPHIAQFLKQTYHLGESTECRIIKAGVNHTYKVSDDNGNYIFRVYALNWRTKEEIEEELKLVNLLKEKGIQVSYPIADAKGNFIQTINAPEGLRYAVMFSFAKGEKLHFYSKEMHEEIGRMLAHIHQHTLGLHLKRPTYTPQTLLIDSFEHLKAFISTETDEMKFMMDTQQILLKELTSNASDLRQGIVHLDIWFDNLNIAADGQVTLFDFDFCGNGWLALDIAYYIMQTFNVERDEPERKAKIEYFLKGYESITPIPAAEKRLLPALGISLYFFYLGVQSKRFDDWSNSFLSETYLKRYITVIVKRYWEEGGSVKSNWLIE
jgi:Ser/Thr protein kinase RdoA (MazF antagonist)